MNNVEKLKEQTLHSAVYEIRGSNIEKGPKATDKTVQPDRRPKSKNISSHQKNPEGIPPWS